MNPNSSKALRFMCRNGGRWSRRLPTAARNWPLLLLLLVLFLPGTGLRLDSDRTANSSGGWDRDPPQLDSFSEPAVAAAILQQQVRGLFQAYLLTNTTGGMTAGISASRTGPESQNQALDQPDVSADGRRNSPSRENQSLFALDGRLRALRSESLQNLLVINCKNCSWNDFIDAYLELLAIAPERAAARCWMREALLGSRTCGRTDEVVDAWQHVTRFGRNPKAIAWIQGFLEDCYMGRYQGLAVEDGFASECGSPKLAVEQAPAHRDG